MPSRDISSIIPFLPPSSSKVTEGHEIEFTNFSDGYFNDLNVKDKSPASIVVSASRSEPILPRPGYFKYHDLGDLNLLTLVWFRTLQSYMSNDDMQHFALSASIAITIAFIFKVVRRCLGEVRSSAARVIYTLMAFYALMVESIVSKMSYFDLSLVNVTLHNSNVNDPLSSIRISNVTDSLELNLHVTNTTIVSNLKGVE